jgi:hypothetical protein
MVGGDRLLVDLHERPTARTFVTIITGDRRQALSILHSSRR